MKKIVILSILACMVLSGCSVVTLSRSGEDIESSIGDFNFHTSYFDRYSSERDETTCKVRGTLYQAAGDDHTVIADMSVSEGGGSVDIIGFMESTRGNLQLIYMAPDGTQTLIAEGVNKDIDVQLNVAEGEGSIAFIGDEESAVCEFIIKIEATEGMTFTGIMEHDSIEDLEDMEDLEDIEESESPTIQEEIEMPEETIEDAGLDEIIENNWSESKSIRYCGNGVYANPMSTRFQIDAPVTLSVSCATAGGKLRLKIVRMGILGDVGQTIYFDEANPDGAYTVELDQKGTYKVLFYAKEHVGSVEIIAVDD